MSDEKRAAPPHPNFSSDSPQRRSSHSIPGDTPNLILRSLDRAARLSKRVDKLSRQVETLSNQLELWQNRRLLVAGAFFIALVVLAIQPSLRLEIPVLLAFAITFGLLVARTRKIEKHLKRLRALRLFYDRQERRCLGLPSGRAFESAERASEKFSPLPRDLLIFGPHSLWTLLDETLTDGGQQRLLEWLHQPLASAEEVRNRQERTKALRRERWFFTRLALLGSHDDFRLSSSQVLLFLKKPFTGEHFNKALAFAWTSFLLAWSHCFHLAGQTSSAEQGSGSWAFLWPLAVFALINIALVLKTGSRFKQGIGLSHHLSLLAPIFDLFESRLKQSKELCQMAPVTSVAGPSRQARKLERILAFLSIEANPLLALMINAFAPWTLTATFALERRRQKIAFSFPQCLDELAEVESFGSLVIFDFYQTNCCPQILSPGGTRPTLDFQQLWHPLIARTHVVANGFTFPPGKSLGLITGSNMSGKSTFLRTVGINQVLANLGAPVFAASMSTQLMRIETCIEVSDSLRDGYSYFYAEVRRLKNLIDACEASNQGLKTLFLVDEIFRGTNNRERHIGSRAVIRKLATASQALGFISTHDLELTAAEHDFPSVLNLHFREEIAESGEMLFTYLLHRGSCPTTNALKIMQQAGIQIEE